MILLAAAAAGGDRWQKCSALCTTIRKYMMKYHQGDLNGCVFCFACAWARISIKNSIITWALKLEEKWRFCVGIYQGSKPHHHFSQRLDNVLFHFQSAWLKNGEKMRLRGALRTGSWLVPTSKGKCIFIKLQLLKLSKKSWVSNIGGLMFLGWWQLKNMALKHYILEWYLILVPPVLLFLFFETIKPINPANGRPLAIYGAV